ncbi:MAG: SdiA-regulated domain-containing protein [Phycisphaerales bacterium]
MPRITPIILLAAAASSASASITSLNLANYSLTASYNLDPVLASEASAVTFNWNTGTLFVLGDEGDAVVEVSTTGALLSSMTLTGFDDTEGLTFTGGGNFVITEERLQDAYSFTYTAGGAISRGSLANASIGPTVGNVGVEGISYDPRNGRFITVKEKTPQAVLDNTITFGFPGSVSSTSLFSPALGLLDLSDVQVLATVPSLIGTADEENLLVYSQESARLLEVTRTGTVLSSFDLTGIDNAEGVTIGADGTIYIVGENPTLYVLTPTPGAASLFALAGMMAARRRRA